ncbi:hypothetical protein FS837_004814, partial [Tulasnella sp. UAMH 9824]
MKAYDTCTRIRRIVLQKPLLQKESFGPTTERMTDVLADYKGTEDATGFGNTLPTSSAVAPGVDDDELKDELEMPNEEQKKEDETEKVCVTVEERRQAEEKGRARVEAEKNRKAKEEAETLGQEEDEVRRKLEEVEVSPETDLRKRIGRSGTMRRGRRKLLSRQEMIGGRVEHAGLQEKEKGRELR